MWQIRGDSSNELRPHVQVNGTYTQLKAVRLPMTIGLNTTHHVRINAVGSHDHDLHRRRAGRRHDRHAQPERLDRLPPRQHGVRRLGQRQGHEHRPARRSTATTSTPPAPTSPAARSATASSPSAPRRDCSYGLTDNWAFLRKTLHDRRQADRLGDALRLRALDRARPPVRLQALAQRQGRRRRPDPRDQQRDDVDVQRLRRHVAAQARRRQRARRARLHDDRQAASSPSS